MTSTHWTNTIALETGSDCDAQGLVTVLNLSGTRGRVGLREIVDLGDGIMGRVGIRGGHKLIIKLNARDLFDVEIGHPVHRVDWAVDVQERDVHVEDLAETIIRMAEGVLQ